MTEAAEEMTPEKEAEFRKEVIAELAAEESGEPIEAPAKPAEDPEPEPEVDPETEVDPWAGVNPALKEQFDEMSTRVSGLDATEVRLKQAESRIGAITNELGAAKKAAKEVAAAPTEDQVKEAAESEEKWKELKEDFPDWAIAIDTRLASFEKKMTPGIDQETLKAELETLKTTMKTESAVEIEKAILSFAHPDWEQTDASEEFGEWLKGQPKDVTAKSGSARAVDVISVLDAFAESQSENKNAAEIAEKRKKQLKLSELTPGRKATPAKSEADMTEAELRSSIAKEVFADN